MSWVNFYCIVIFVQATMNSKLIMHLSLIHILYGSVTSSSATLSVVQPPLFTVPLAGQTIQCSSNASLNVMVIATPPPAYQWSLDGATIAGATNTSLTLTNVHLPSHLVSCLLYTSVKNPAPPARSPWNPCWRPAGKIACNSWMA